MLKIYNTLSREKEIFKPIKKKNVSLYTCGPTVYSSAHIGNLRSFIFSDVLKRVLIYNNYKVKHVMNFTDVDDKTIKGTINEYGENTGNKELNKYTEKYIKLFKEDIVKLNIIKPFFVRATEIIDDIKKIIKALIKDKFAYIKDGSTYFNILKYNKAFKDYGNLAGKSFLKGLKIGKAVNSDEYEKENAGDFALWKKENKNVFWKDSSLGNGRPGWHIECSIISMKYFGKQFDIHTGGVDLIFPHHSNEIAQSQAYSKKIPFVKYWIHSEHLMVENEKMAKSKGNFYTLKDIEKKFNPLAFRYLCLSSHYDTKLNFTWKSLESSQNALNKLYEKAIELKSKKVRLSQKAESYKDKFTYFINDNLDTVKAIALLWKMLREKQIKNNEKYSLLLDFDKIFGLNIEKAKESKIPKNVKELVLEREEARRQKNWKKADEIRKKILEVGYEIEDKKLGSKIKKTCS